MVTPYVVAARKYRPQNLQQLIGQTALVQALSAAFASQRIPHAFLLTGIRGVGKTTTARIIASGLNCLKFDAPTLQPCGVCALCVGATQSSHPDILEIDAASNNGVDNVREIVDSVRYRPVDARFRVFIIDEVHMLSKAAFNALLKTLEEPPAHAVFILATTELNKVPVTIVSRCRRLVLQRIALDTLQAHLQSVCAAEGFSCTDDAARALAIAADGSVRDGLSLLDQAIACAPEGCVDRSIVDVMLGLCTPEGALELFTHICHGRADAACAHAQKLLSSGIAARQILSMLLDICTALLKTSAQVQTAHNFFASEQALEALQQLSQHMAAADVMAMWQIIAALYDQAQYLPDNINIIEHAVLRLLYATTLPPLPQLLKQWQPDGLPNMPARPLGANATLSPPKVLNKTAPSVGTEPALTASEKSMGANITSDTAVQAALKVFPQATVHIEKE